MRPAVSGGSVSSPALTIRPRLDGMTPMGVHPPLSTFTKPDLDTTIVATIKPAHLQTNLDILEKGPLPSDLYEKAKILYPCSAAGTSVSASTQGSADRRQICRRGENWARCLIVPARKP